MSINAFVKTLTFQQLRPTKTDSRTVTWESLLHVDVIQVVRKDKTATV